MPLSLEQRIKREREITCPCPWSNGSRGRGRLHAPVSGATDQEGEGDYMPLSLEQRIKREREITCSCLWSNGSRGRGRLHAPVSGATDQEGEGDYMKGFHSKYSLIPKPPSNFCHLQELPAEAALRLEPPFFPPAPGRQAALSGGALPLWK